MTAAQPERRVLSLHHSGDAVLGLPGTGPWMVYPEAQLRVFREDRITEADIEAVADYFGQTPSGPGMPDDEDREAAREVLALVFGERT